MPHSLGPLRGPVRWITATPRRSATRALGRATVGGVALAGLLGLAAHTSLSALASPDSASAPPAAEAERLAFAERHRAVQHGGFVRAANTSLTCGTTPSCDGARDGRAGANDDFAMEYVDIDDDPRTANSSRAEVRLPTGARVTYARLYWGGNLLAGERRAAKDNARVLLAAPGGAYHEVRADTVVGHRTARGADAFQASADVTRQTHTGGPGLYTVAQINAARGRSGGGAGVEGAGSGKAQPGKAGSAAQGAGAWAGWTLVVAYEHPAEPLRRLVLWDGFEALDRAGHEIRVTGLGAPPGAWGQAGLVAYNGDRGRGGDTLTVSADRRAPVPLGDASNPFDDVLNSTVTGAPGRREPAYEQTLGYDSDVFEIGSALRRGGDQLAFRLVSQPDAAWAGVLFVAVDVPR
ncbi:DUF3344 domain-containing protein [Streptomyces sp. NPDC056716]|uniref:DUF3344 domain-containing protein n=1 Tax=unclassified Streptomyces TaxID=2593676 RepID=UPI003689C907